MTRALLLAVSLCLASLPVQAEPLDQQGIKRFLLQFNHALGQRDTPAVSQLLADDARICINLYDGKQQQSLHIGKQAFLQHLRERWRQISFYSLLRDSVAIAIDGERSTVQSTLRERLQIRDQHLQQTIHETATVENINGHLLLTYLKADVSF